MLERLHAREFGYLLPTMVEEDRRVFNQSWQVHHRSEGVRYTVNSSSRAAFLLQAARVVVEMVIETRAQKIPEFYLFRSQTSATAIPMHFQQIFGLGVLVLISCYSGKCLSLQVSISMASS